VPPSIESVARNQDDLRSFKPSGRIRRVATKRATWGGAREGAGRKALPRRLKRSRRIGISVSPSEYEELERIAKGKPVSGYVYALVLRALGRQEVEP